MNVIIRLQELPWSANAMDIRKFFSGLSIPEGGVHIVGGAAGDAFIAFSSDEDARQAMLLSSGIIHGSNVRLLLSSRTEMQKVIEVARSGVPQNVPSNAPLASPAIGSAQPFPGYPGTQMPGQNSASKNDEGPRSQTRTRSRSRSRSPRARKRSTDSWSQRGSPAIAATDTRLSLEVRGLPDWASVADLHELFAAYRVVPGGIRIMPSVEEPGTAVGVVRFVSPRVKEDAFRRAPRKFRGQTAIEIICLDGTGNEGGNGTCSGILPERGNMEDLTRREQPMRGRQHGKRVLELSGLPFSCHEDDIRRFLKGCDIRSLQIQHENGRPTGQAIVEMISDADVVVALKLDREKLGGRTVRVGLASTPAQGRVVEPDLGRRDHEVEDIQEPTDCCLVQKLPLDATDRDIVHFFSEMGVVPITIHLMLNKGGQPSGDAFCVFHTPDDCFRALRKRCGFVGNHFVHAVPVRREKMREALGHVGPFPTERSQQMEPARRVQEVHPRIELGMQQQQLNDRGDMGPGLRGDYSERRLYPDVDRQREQYTNADRGLGLSHDISRGLGPFPDVDRGTGLFQDVDRNRGMFQDGDRGRTQFHEVGRGQYADVDQGRAHYMEVERNRGQYGEQNRNNVPDQRKLQDSRLLDRFSGPVKQTRFNPRDPDTFGNPGCVVSVTNIPYRASVSDIIAFFGQDYKLSSENVIRRFNDIGQPMGEARVAFKTRLEAESAIRSHHMKRMEGRSISVSLI